jgi:hypothetical protein
MHCRYPISCNDSTLFQLFHEIDSHSDMLCPTTSLNLCIFAEGFRIKNWPFIVGVQPLRTCVAKHGNKPLFPLETIAHR